MNINQPFRLQFRNTPDGWYVCTLHCLTPPCYDLEMGRILIRIVADSETLQKQFSNLMCESFNHMLQSVGSEKALDFCVISPGGQIGHG